MAYSENEIKSMESELNKLMERQPKLELRMSELICENEMLKATVHSLNQLLRANAEYITERVK